MVYKIRAILNVEEDVIRDVAILKTETLEDLHNALSNAFGLEGNEMAAFYESDDTWFQGEEFPLFNMGEGTDAKIQMSEIPIENIIESASDKMIYVYDFFNMWTFYIELIDTDFEHDNYTLPNTLFALGVLPKNAPELSFESDSLSDFEDDEDDEDEYGFNDYM